MDYEKKYNEALERARKAYNSISPENYGARRIIEDAFPELRESEDERIRKYIIEFIKLNKGTNLSPDDADRMLAYLEKQKEQKSSTPKFRVGDMMRTKQEAAEGITDGLPVIVSVDNDYYYCTNEKIPITEQEEYEFPPMNMRQKPANEQFPPLEGLDAIKAKYYDDGFKNGFDEGVESVKPAEWSEEDEEALDMCLDAIPKKWKTKSGILLTKWLKDNFRSSWKPSEEQMDALSYTLQVMNTDLSPIAARTYQGLQEIHRNLRKLTQEG